MADLQAAIRAATASKDPTPVEWGGRTYMVLPPAQWRNSAIEGINRSQFNKWALGAMGPEDGEAFVAADLTIAESGMFLVAYADAAGQAPGESQPSQD